MVRAPCCDKMGLKKGPWTLEEDRILVSYIEKNGHGNWRALPKLAGLSRCGKSCRLRWINYLRPDIKRGNFTKEEEETIIELHQMLGNRWSTIAAKLPGRTDNEIKNVWHTHLRKRLRPKLQPSIPECGSNDVVKTESLNVFHSTTVPVSPQPSLSEISSMTEASVMAGEVNNIDNNVEYSLEPLPMIDESFWSDFGTPNDDITQMQTPFPLDNFSMDNNGELTSDQSYRRVVDDGMDQMDFWYDLFVEAEGALEFPEF